MEKMLFETEPEFKVRKFLKALSELSREYGVVVEGCGCCGSPWVSISGHPMMDIVWDEDEKCYRRRRDDD